MNKTIIVTGGGTAGHVFPGIAVVDVLLEKWDGDIVWIGSNKGMERNILERAGVMFYGIPSGKLRRYFSIKNFFDLFRIVLGFFVSLFIFVRLKPALLFSKGGYVSVPPVFAARFLKIPVISHESDTDPGLATKINSRFSGLLCLSWEETRGYFQRIEAQRIVVTGNPVRKEILIGNRDYGRKLLSVGTDNTPVVLIMGGSQGARQINSLVAANYDRLCSSALVVHQSGKERLPIPNGDRYRQFRFIYEELPHFMAAADLVISRAGANTLWELSALGKPSLLIPLGGGSSRGDQIKNAALFEQKGASMVLTGKDPTPETFINCVESLLSDPAVLKKMGEAALKIGNSGAAERIAELILNKILEDVWKLEL